MLCTNSQLATNHHQLPSINQPEQKKDMALTSLLYVKHPGSRKLSDFRRDPNILSGSSWDLRPRNLLPTSIIQRLTPFRGMMENHARSQPKHQ